jgi:hypothetical protein
MDEKEFRNLIKELKEAGFINQDRKILPSPRVKYLIFASRNEIIEYASEALVYFNREDICWVLLHEEYHCSSLIGCIPYFSETYASKHADEIIVLFDSNVIPNEVFKSYLVNAKKYRNTLPKLTKTQKFLSNFGLLK